MFLILLLFMLFASTFTIGKAALLYTEPVFFIGTRMLIAGALLIFYQVIRGNKLRFALKDLGLIAQICFFQYYMAFLLEFWALQYVSASKTCLLFNLAPFVTALISFFLLGEYLTKRKFLGLVIGFVGLMPILQESAPSEQLAGSVSWLSLPELALLGSVFCASYGWILIQKIQDRGYSVLSVNAVTMAGAGVASLLTSFVLEGMPHITPPAECHSQMVPWLCQAFGDYGAGVAIFLLYLFALILIANVAAFNLYGYLLSIYSATFLAFAGFITPLFTVLFDWLWLGQTVGKEFWISMIMVSVGLFIFYIQELQAKK